MKYFLTLVFCTICLTALGQTSNLNIDSTKQDKENLKTLFVKNKFTSTRSKKKISDEILNKVEIDSINQIAGRRERWESGCVRTGELPHIKLNWVAKTKTDIWIICLTYGGFTSSTFCYVIQKNEVKEIRYGNFETTFKAFRQWCLLGQPREKF